MRPRRGLQASQLLTGKRCDKGVGFPTAPPWEATSKEVAPTPRHPSTQVQSPSQGRGHGQSQGLPHSHGHHAWLSQPPCATLRLALRVTCRTPHTGPVWVS